MATQTQYYNLDKPSYDEVADIEIINANMDKIDTQMRNNADGVNFAKGISSDAYDNSKLYAVGDYCIYDNKLYRCITDIESAEAFNVEKWEQTTVGKEVKQLNSNLDGLEFGEVAGGKNLIDVSKVIRGEMVGGNVSDGNNYITDFIHLEYGKNYILSNCYKEVHETAWFTQDKTFVQRTFGVEVTPPTNDCYYARIEYGVEQGINAQLEKGTQATECEPYIPSVKMLAEEVNAQNESLAEQGLLNISNGWKQGYYYEGEYIENAVQCVCCVSPISCKAGDKLILKYPNAINIRLSFMNGSTFISTVSENNVTEISATAPANTTNVIYWIYQEEGNIYPNTALRVTLYINNAIEQIKNDLGGLSLSVSGTTLSITDGTNTWTLEAN